MPKQITHLIIGLGKGGAETMLYQVLKYRTDLNIEHKVVSFGAAHYYEEPIRELGIELIETDIRKNPLKAMAKAFQTIKGTDTLCCWMYYANFLGYILGKAAGVKRIIWNIRHSNLDPAIYKKLLLKINKWCAIHSKNVDVIAYNGQLARKVHEQNGYCPPNAVVLDNGCDCEVYKPDILAAVSVRNELGIPENKKMILSVAKDHPIKDIPTFLEAFASVHKELPDTVAIMCGSGIEEKNERIQALCTSRNLQIGRDIYLLGMRHDVSRLLAGCDLYVLHSAGEAFPNSLIQAMACGCLCVATDVGDVRRILPESRFVCPPQTPAILCQTINCILNSSQSEQRAIRLQNRARVVEAFTIQNAVMEYERQY